MFCLLVDGIYRLTLNLLFVFQTFSTANSVNKSQAKDIITIVEACMKNLEKADSIVLPASDEKERKRRKVLVNSFHNPIISAEKLQSTLDCMCNEPPTADSSK
ncbi:hypothetical protein ECG_04662 [Echinococcus granulosus]|uniref:Expressed protein n=1 Tax=Echinococcus granulosus TaxID=6210 RepID=A0A068WH82_ECHGR|nr:hypothetical protein ECG_04662 [Echinococcus granulosus]CDS17043.1 expressed protein [Echinococcus granulosus]